MADEAVRIRVIEGRDPHDELVSLRAWLVQEDELRGRITVDTPAIQPGEMGALSDVLVVAMGGGGVLTVLARSLPTWLKQRRADVTIEIHGADGRKTKVTANRITDAEAVIREVLSADSKD